MNVRETALYILEEVEQGAYINLTLNAILNRNQFSRKDADFLTRLVYITVQNQIYLDAYMESLLEDKKIKRLERLLLRMSLAQLVLFDRIPQYAVIDEAVEIIKKRRGKHAAGFMNALLHQLTSLEKPNLDKLDWYKKMSIKYSHPEWMVRMFAKQYGNEVTEKILIENQKTPILYGRVNSLKTDIQTLLEKYDIISQGPLFDTTVVLKGAFDQNHPLYKDGLITIQDLGSQAVSLFLNPKKGCRVLDMCAAPGSKTCHLAALMDNIGEIYAYDLHDHKIPLIQQNAKRLGVDIIKAKAYDACHLDDLEELESFDYVLLDGPCSGLGVLARKPEIRYHDSTTLDQLGNLQKSLLDSASKMVKKEGVLVYSTCTLNKKENEKNVAWFLEKHPEFELIDEQTIFPFMYHSDGFYMARMVKR